MTQLVPNRFLLDLEFPLRRFATPPALDGRLTDWTIERPTFIDDPQARAEGLVMPALHPQWGAYLRHGAQVILHGASGTHDTLQGATLCGEHTNALLAELGIDADERHALRAARMVA